MSLQLANPDETVGSESRGLVAEHFAQLADPCRPVRRDVGEQMPFAALDTLSPHSLTQMEAHLTHRLVER